MFKQYFEEDELVQKVQSGEMTMHGYVTHHSKAWDDEYADFCREQGLDPEEEVSAEDFLQFKDALLSQAQEEGNL